MFFIKNSISITNPYPYFDCKKINGMPRPERCFFCFPVSQHNYNFTKKKA